MTPDEDAADRSAGAEGSWPAWRKVMLAGALLALGAAVLRATDVVPPVAEAVASVVAFVVLAAGFGHRMRNPGTDRR